MEISGVSWELVAAIAGILVTVFVAYHIAIRQGVFSKASLLASFAAPTEEIPEAFAEIVLVAVPSSSRFQITLLPIVIQNRGTSPIRNLWVNLAYPQEIAVRSKEDVVSALGEVKWPAGSREETVVNEQLNVSYEIPLIRRDETLVLGEPVVCDGKRLSHPTDDDFRSFAIFFQYNAENTRRFRKYVKVAFVSAADLAGLQGRFSAVVQEIIHAKGPLLVPAWLALISRLFRKTIREVQCLLIAPSLQVIGTNVSVDEALLGKSGTAYQDAQLAIYVKVWPSGKRVTRLKARELRKKHPERFV